MKIKFLLASVLLVFIVSCSSDIQKEDSETVSNFLSKKTKSLWNEEDFYKVRSIQIGNSEIKTSNKGFQISEGLIIEEISKEAYEIANQDKKRFYLKDTLALIKRNKEILIGKTSLKDSNLKNGSFEFYSYLGYFPIMNQYLIKGEYLDSLDYKMIDKNSGEIKQSFINYPIISKTGNFVAVSKTNEIEKQTYLDIYNFNNGVYKESIKAIFINWKVIDFEEFTFWGNNGSLYMKIDKMGNATKKFETFIKITLN